MFNGMKFLSFVAALSSLFLISCNDVAEDYIEEPADNIGICWECDELSLINAGNSRIQAEVLSGDWSYTEKLFFFDQNDTYLGWEEFDYVNDFITSETYEYDAFGDLEWVISFDGFDSIYTPVSIFETTDTIFWFYDLLEFRYSKADGDEIPEVVIEYIDYDYLDEWQRFYYQAFDDGTYEIISVFDGDTSFSQSFIVDDNDRILEYYDGFEDYRYKYFKGLKNPYPKSPYPTWIPHMEDYSLLDDQYAKVLHNGDLPQMLIDPSGNVGSDTLYLYYD